MLFRSPEDKDHWILDEEAAPVVKMIFDLCIDGKGPEQIARILEEKQILTTRVLYAKRKGCLLYTSKESILDSRPMAFSVRPVSRRW